MKMLQRKISAAALCLLSFVFIFSLGVTKARAYVTIGAEIPVNCKKITDNNTHVYKIGIKAENNDSPAPNSDLLEVSENGMGRFEININEPGTFRYRIFEIPGSDPEFVYDNNIYDVVVYVENAAGDGLTYSVVAHSSGRDTKPDVISFADVVKDSSQPESNPEKVPEPDPDPEPEPVPEPQPQPSGEPEIFHTINIGERMSGGVIDVFLTGEAFTVTMLVLVTVAVSALAVSVFLFKRKKTGEEDKDEK